MVIWQSSQVLYVQYVRLFQASRTVGLDYTLTAKNVLGQKGRLARLQGTLQLA